MARVGSFDFSRIRINWFPGHMAKGLREMEERLKFYIPISSVNPRLDELISSKRRIIVFNKADLSLPNQNGKLKQKMISNNGEFLIASSDHKPSIRGLLKKIVAPYKGQVTQPDFKITLMVVGIPNVGKSSWINSLRFIGTNVGGKAVAVGKLPGVTKSVSEVVRICNQPKTYLLDTPGIMIPKITNPEVGMKIALIGGIHERHVGEYSLAEYCLYVMNSYGNGAYQKFLNLDHQITDITEFLEAVALRIGALMEGGRPDLLKSAIFVIKAFRNGTFGKYTLDEF